MATTGSNLCMVSVAGEARDVEAESPLLMGGEATSRARRHTRVFALAAVILVVAGAGAAIVGTAVNKSTVEEAEDSTKSDIVDDFDFNKVAKGLAGPVIDVSDAIWKGAAAVTDLVSKGGRADDGTWHKVGAAMESAGKACTGVAEGLTLAEGPVGFCTMLGCSAAGVAGNFLGHVYNDTSSDKSQGLQLKIEDINSAMDSSWQKFAAALHNTADTIKDEISRGTGRIIDEVQNLERVYQCDKFYDLNILIKQVGYYYESYVIKSHAPVAIGEFTYGRFLEMEAFFDESALNHYLTKFEGCFGDKRSSGNVDELRTKFSLHFLSGRSQLFAVFALWCAATWGDDRCPSDGLKDRSEIFDTQVKSYRRLLVVRRADGDPRAQGVEGARRAEGECPDDVTGWTLATLPLACFIETYIGASRPEWKNVSGDLAHLPRGATHIRLWRSLHITGHLRDLPRSAVVIDLDNIRRLSGTFSDLPHTARSLFFKAWECADCGVATDGSGDTGKCDVKDLPRGAMTLHFDACPGASGDFGDLPRAGLGLHFHSSRNLKGKFSALPLFALFLDFAASACANCGEVAGWRDMNDCHFKGLPRGAIWIDFQSCAGACGSVADLPPNASSVLFGDIESEHVYGSLSELPRDLELITLNGKFPALKGSIRDLPRHIMSFKVKSTIEGDWSALPATATTVCFYASEPSGTRPSTCACNSPNACRIKPFDSDLV